MARLEPRQPRRVQAYRTQGNSLNANSVITSLTPVALPATATNYVDAEELPDGVRFTYWTKALFVADLTGPSILARVTAVNQAPVAAGDSYTASGAVVTGNVLTNDTDPDIGPNGKNGWSAVLVNSSGVPVPAPTGLTFGSNGSFSYLTVNGPLTFYYRIDTGLWTDGTNSADMSADSNVALVTISVPPPPDSTKPALAGLTVTPSTIWSPNGKKLPVTISGRATDTGNGLASISLDVEDEYNLDEPDVTYAIGAPGLTYNPTTGAFSFVVQLTASRLGSDKDGRKYSLTVKATDRQGNVGIGPTMTVTAHTRASRPARDRPPAPARLERGAGSRVRGTRCRLEAGAFADFWPATGRPSSRREARCTRGRRPLYRALFSSCRARPR